MPCSYSMRLKSWEQGASQPQDRDLEVTVTERESSPENLDAGLIQVKILNRVSQVSSKLHRAKLKQDSEAPWPTCCVVVGPVVWKSNAQNKVYWMWRGLLPGTVYFRGRVPTWRPPDDHVITQWRRRHLRNIDLARLAALEDSIYRLMNRVGSFKL